MSGFWGDLTAGGILDKGLAAYMARESRREAAAEAQATADQAELIGTTTTPVTGTGPSAPSNPSAPSSPSGTTTGGGTAGDLLSGTVNVGGVALNKGALALAVVALVVALLLKR